MKKNDKDKEETRITQRDNTAKSAAAAGSGLAFIFLAILSAISTHKVVAKIKSAELEKVTYNNIVSNLERELKSPESKPKAIRELECKNTPPEIKLAAEMIIRRQECKNIPSVNPEFEKMFDHRIY